MYRKKGKTKILLFFLFLLGILLCGVVLSIAFFPPTLNIRSEPPDASIYINCAGQNAKTPSRLRILDIFGRHRVMVSKNDYQPHSREVSFSLFRRTIDIDAPLEKEPFSWGDKNILVGWVDGSRYPEVKVMIKVKDQKGQMVLDLKKENISLMETREECCRNAQPDFNLRDVNKMDIVFFIDVTGSMKGTLDVVKQNIEAFCDLLLAQNLNFRLAGYSFEDNVPYRDKFEFPGEFTDRSSARNMAKKFKKWLGTLKADKGGDAKENCLGPIIDAGGGGLNYRPGATKIGVLITDTWAHVAGDGGDSPTTATFEAARARLNSSGINLYYASPKKEYESKLGAKSLGWPFSAPLLTDKFSEELIGWYTITFKDGITVEKNKARRCTLRVWLNPQNKEISKECIKNFVFYPLNR